MTTWLLTIGILILIIRSSIRRFKQKRFNLLLKKIYFPSLTAEFRKPSILLSRLSV